MHIGEIVKVGEREPTYTPAEAQPESAPQHARPAPELFPGIPAANPDAGEPDSSPYRELEPAFVEPRRETAESLKKREFEES